MKPTRSPFWIWTFIGIVIFWCAAFLSDPKPMGEFMRLFVVSLSVAVAVSYSADALASANKRKPGADDLLMLGIVAGNVGTALVGTWLLLWRVSGQPSWFINTDWMSSLACMQVLGAILHLMAPGAINGRVPKRNMLQVGVIVGLTFLAAFTLVFYTPAMRELVRKLRPIIEQPNHEYDMPARFKNDCDGPVVHYSGLPKMSLVRRA